MNENPYQPPESNLIDKDKNELKRSTWWKIYFFVFNILYVLSLIFIVLDPKAGFPEFVESIIYITYTIGFFGFVFLKPIYKPKFWFMVFLISLFYGVIYSSITEIDFRNGLSDSDYYIDIAISWLISFPAYYALYSYSRPANPIWTQKSGEKYKAF